MSRRIPGFSRSSALKPLFIGAALVSSLTGCGANDSVQEIEYYHVAYRQSPPEPVYSRFTWSQTPGPIRTKVRDEAPLFLPTISFELPNSNLDEAIEALAQTIGYGWKYPDGVKNRKIRIRMTGTVEEVLEEIGRQANVHGVLDHENRIVQVMEQSTSPSLPAETSTPEAGL